MNKGKKGISKMAFGLSVATLILAGVVSVFGLDNLWLAGTQWILISIILAIYAIYLNGCDCSCFDSNKEKNQ